jgi:very-short-patch-repair endonuclease
MKKPYLPYNKSLKQISRNLRNNSTLSEVLLWNEIKAGKLKGYKFRRQKPLGNYVVDFYCKDLNLVIEIDGVSHIDKELKDIKRQETLEKFNLNFLRFDDIQIKQALNYVIDEILNYIEKFESHDNKSPF